jgi:hypothetical protein
VARVARTSDRPGLRQAEGSQAPSSGRRWVVPLDDRPYALSPAKWAPPCPDGRPQRLCHPLGFRERDVGELELRVALGGDDGGVCQVVVDERDEEVYVRVVVCRHDDDGRASRARTGSMDCPVRVWLEQPLGDRTVIDVDSDERLPLFIPAYMNNVPQADHGYWAAEED